MKHKTLIMIAFFLCLGLFLSPTTRAEDRLVVKNPAGQPTFTVTDDGEVSARYLKGVQDDGTLSRIGAYTSVWDQYGETLLVGGAFNRLAFLTREGGTVEFSPAPTSGRAEHLFGGTGAWVYWQNPSGTITVTINLPAPWKYMRELIIQFVSVYYPTSFDIEYYDEDDSQWHLFDSVTNWQSNLYAKKTGGDLYNTSKLRLTMKAYNKSTYIHIDEIIWTYYMQPMFNAYVHRQGGQNVYGGINLATDSGRVGIGTRTPQYLIDTGGAYCDGYTWEDASSRDYKKDIRELTGDEAMEALTGLNPVKFLYKKDPLADEHVGFIAEEVPELVASKNRKGLSPMDVVAVLTKVVQEQQRTIAELTRKVESLERNQGR